VSDQDLVLDAIEEAQRFLAEHIEPTSRRSHQRVSRSPFVQNTGKPPASVGSKDNGFIQDHALLGAECPARTRSLSVSDLHKYQPSREARANVAGAGLP